MAVSPLSLSLYVSLSLSFSLSISLCILYRSFPVWMGAMHINHNNDSSATVNSLHLITQPLCQAVSVPNTMMVGFFLRERFTTCDYDNGFHACRSSLCLVAFLFGSSLSRSYSLPLHSSVVALTNLLLSQPRNWQIVDSAAPGCPSSQSFIFLSLYLA